MRYISVDIFYCRREDVKRAILQYLGDIEKWGGVICPSYILMRDTAVSNVPEELPNVYRVFSVQRHGRGKECKVVINLSSKRAK